jgi:hypothetical protein
MGDGDDGGMGDAGLGMGGFGDGLGDAGFGGPAPGSMGDAGSMSDAGLGFGFSDASFGDNALGNISNFTDLSTALSDFGLDAMAGLEGMSSFSDALGTVPSFTTDTSFFSNMQDFSKTTIGKAIMGLLGYASKGAIGPANTALSNNPAASIAKGGLGLAAGSVFGPIGALAAPAIADALGLSSAFANAGTVSSFQGNDANMGIGEALPGLAGMFAGYQGMRDSSKMLGGLQDLYSQNSPYAQMLRQQLQRKDAAGGRRSQYGPREVELQAKLAQMASGQIGAMSQLQQRQNINRAQMMQQGLGAFQKMGGIKGLQSLFGMGGMGGMFDTAASQGLQGLPNLFGNNGMDSFGQLPEGLGFDFGLPPFGG